MASTSFGKTLKRIRQDKGLPQREVARRAGMDHARFSRLENDRTGFNPTRETVEKIARALEATSEERAELLTSARRLDREIESLAQIASKQPAVVRLLQIAISLPPEQLEEMVEEFERRQGLLSKHSAGDTTSGRGHKSGTSRRKAQQ